MGCLFLVGVVLVGGWILGVFKDQPDTPAPSTPATTTASGAAPHSTAASPKDLDANHPSANDLQTQAQRQFANRLQNLFLNKGISVGVKVDGALDPHALDLNGSKSDFGDPVARQQFAEVFRPSSHEMCAMGIWFVDLNYFEGFMNLKRSRINLHCPEQVSQALAERIAFAKSLQPPSSGGISYTVNATTLVLDSKAPVEAASAAFLGAALDGDQRVMLKLCSLGFTKFQTKGPDGSKITELPCPQ